MQIAQNGIKPGAQGPGRIIEMALQKSPLDAVLHQIVGQSRVRSQRPGKTTQMRNLGNELSAKIHDVTTPYTQARWLLFPL
jgi:hypothetical protein